MTADGLVRVASGLGPRQTMDRLAKAIGEKGLTVFARIDHADGARQAGLALRPTELIVFGNAKGGTPLMQAGQEMGIDLPLKMLVYQDAEDRTWLVYNELPWLAERHHLSEELSPNIAMLGKLLEALAAAAAGHS